jgi:hypothetical protein
VVGLQESDGGLTIPDLSLTFLEELSSSAKVTRRQNKSVVLGVTSADGAKSMIDLSLGKVCLHAAQHLLSQE